ncbi:hypothetical protein HPP92_010987 [Vanilla planifolia]|uniref:Uncharacterized protein n=1 Tax=Vanilla planifolia TaxID=51239 RepID=A0A835UY16_VANPL|nr:hypothetical protein HPP92_010987 [Vanilla planifolia]
MRKLIVKCKAIKTIIRTPSTVSFHEGYPALHGDKNLILLGDGKTSSGYLPRTRTVEWRCVRENHDELDFEFLGNIRGKEWSADQPMQERGSTGLRKGGEIQPLV